MSKHSLFENTHPNFSGKVNLGIWYNVAQDKELQANPPAKESQPEIFKTFKTHHFTCASTIDPPTWVEAQLPTCPAARAARTSAKVKEILTRCLRR